MYANNFGFTRESIFFSDSIRLAIFSATHLMLLQHKKMWISGIGYSGNEASSLISFLRHHTLASDLPVDSWTIDRVCLWKRIGSQMPHFIHSSYLHNFFSTADLVGVKRLEVCLFMTFFLIYASICLRNQLIPLLLMDPHKKIHFYRECHSLFLKTKATTNSTQDFVGTNVRFCNTKSY